MSSTNLQVQFAAVLLNYSGCDCLLPLQVQFAAVLLNYSGCDCLLPIQVQLQLYFRTTQAQLCTTNSRATVYYLEFILFYLVILAIIWLQNILFLPLAYLNLRLLSLELHPLSQKHPLQSPKLHRLSQIHHLLKLKTSSYIYLIFEHKNINQDEYKFSI